MIRFYRSYANRDAFRGNRAPSDQKKREVYEFVHQSDCFSRKGLTQAEAGSRRELYGLNRIGGTRSGVYGKLQFPLLLLGFAALLGFSRDPRSALLIAVAAVLSAGFRFRQVHAAKLLAKANARLADARVRTLRDGLKQNVPVTQLVPGDIVYLSSGDPVPADIKLIAARDLLIDHSVLTGDSTAQKKATARRGSEASSLLELPNVCLMGSTLVRGTATGVVLRTGRETYLSSLLQGPDPLPASGGDLGSRIESAALWPVGDRTARRETHPFVIRFARSRAVASTVFHADMAR
jgi:magnesium-transporting ATPase (P-type)